MFSKFLIRRNMSTDHINQSWMHKFVHNSLPVGHSTAVCTQLPVGHSTSAWYEAAMRNELSELGVGSNLLSLKLKDYVCILRYLALWQLGYPSQVSLVVARLIASCLGSWRDAQEYNSLPFPSFTITTRKSVKQYLKLFSS